MQLIEKVELIPRRLISDDRGWFLKVIEGTENGMARGIGEVYLTMAKPGQVRGNHYHLLANEWFTIVNGNARVLLADPVTGSRKELNLSSENPFTLFVPAGIAHCFVNLVDSNEFLLVAYSDKYYDPNDTLPYTLL